MPQEEAAAPAGGDVEEGGLFGRRGELVAEIVVVIDATTRLFDGRRGGAEGGRGGSSEDGLDHQQVGVGMDQDGEGRWWGGAWRHGRSADVIAGRRAVARLRSRRRVAVVAEWGTVGGPGIAGNAGSRKSGSSTSSAGASGAAPRWTVRCPTIRRSSRGWSGRGSGWGPRG